MKQVLTQMTLLFLSVSGFSQISVSNNNNVGIGIAQDYTPTAKLEIEKKASGAESLLKLTVSDAKYDYLKIVNGTRSGETFIPTIVGNVGSKATIGLYLIGSTTYQKDIESSLPIVRFDARRDTGAPITKRLLYQWGSYTINHMTMNSKGYLGLGTTAPTHRLHVVGKIYAKDLEVPNKVPADYVFEKYYDGTSDLNPNYKMPTLEEVESFTKENKHLPHIPSAKEIQENGMQLGEMSNLLLQKIEELTLYTIEQQKQLKLQSEELQNQKEEMEKLKKEIGH